MGAASCRAATADRGNGLAAPAQQRTRAAAAPTQRRRRAAAAAAAGAKRGELEAPVVRDPAGADTRRAALRRLAASGAALLAAAAATTAAPPAAAATALADVTPPLAPAPPLPAREQAIVDAFEGATYSVVNVFDVALQGRPASALDAEVPEGNGSGVIWDQEGNVVTNYHVLASSMAKLNVDKDAAGARGKRVAVVTVLSADGERRSFDASLVGADRARDLAVLKVSAPRELLRPAALAESGGVRVGQQVLSIGNPFGAFDHTLTMGIVSALNRDIRSQTGSIIPGGIQTDCAINPGNSGGPLLTSSGRVIGINTAIFTNTGSSAGVGFAIPSDTVAAIVPQLIAGGVARRAGLGAQIASDLVAQKLGVRAGAMLQTVAPGGAAAAAGLLPTRRGLGGIAPGDTVLAVDGTPTPNAAALLGALERRKPGETVQLRVARAGEGGDKGELTVGVTLQAE
ncbi:protease Do-like protein, chloroplastic [Raphidocelis subcapitata]|uniref:Protease Do-like protein, chloroplastic n=1 Tax=Raphidocelis subcapitata TaxID=307507 RepID=A0A2V0NQD5_9CHLO|nr:protease Do-like protein, chloroplastic [Raphidocelis subcapitata]|eukprot:GBF87750.1 protease Do-like protein, chloroplastic [Raphidocelis subcapitata]